MKLLAVALAAGMLFIVGARADERDSDRRSDRDPWRLRHPHDQNRGRYQEGVTRPGDANPYEPKVGASNPYATQGGQQNPYATQGGTPSSFPAQRGGRNWEPETQQAPRRR